MNFTTVLKNKQAKSLQIREKYKFLKKYSAIGIIYINDKNLIKDIRDGLTRLPIGFIFVLDGVEESHIAKNIIVVGKTPKTDEIGYDFIVTDGDTSKLTDLFHKAVTPITLKKNSLGTILQDFNPIKNTGNAFLFDELNKWDVYGAIVRYLENKRFPQDNKNLMKNVLKI